jgi:RecA-family ATPase
VPAAEDVCPFVGLRPYTDAERDYFFGRERDQRVISSNLYAASLTILYGESGVGKSSVLLAGVVPGASHARLLSSFANGNGLIFWTQSSPSV